RAMTLGLAARGAKVAAVELSAARAQATAADGPVGAVLPLPADVTQQADTEGAVERCLAAFGGLHMLVNCAGLGMHALRDDYHSNPNRFWEADPARWWHIMDVNVRGPFLMARA